MAQTYGPKYPGPSDGLVFCWDPKNRECWNGGLTDFNNNAPEPRTVLGIGLGASDVNNAPDGYIPLDGTDTRITGSVAPLYNGDRTISTWFRSPDWKNLATDTVFAIGGYSVAQPSWNPINYIQIYNNDGDDQWNRIRIGGAHSGTTNLWTNGAAVPGDSDFIGSDYWYNITLAYVQSTGVYTCYLNAGQTGNSNVTATKQDNAGYYQGNVYLGYLPNITANAFTGDQGPVMVWNRTLSEAEVISSYNALKGRYGR
jgi:hypothetical protein